MTYYVIGKAKFGDYIKLIVKDLKKYNHDWSVLFTGSKGDCQKYRDNPYAFQVR